MRNLIITIAFLISTLNLFSQEHAARLAREKDKVVLRLIPLNEKAWLQNLKGYYKIDVFQLNHSQLADTIHLRSKVPVNNYILKPLSTENWNNIILVNKKASLLLSTLKLSEQQKQNSTQIKMLMGLSLILCDADSTLARAYGLLLNDNYNPDIIYKIQAFDRSNLKRGKPIYISQKLNSETLNKKVQDYSAEAKLNVVRLNWNHQKTSKDFSCYNIERSTNKIKFEKVNRESIVPIRTQYESHKTESSYYDTIQNYNGVLYYRIQGISAFGIKSDTTAIDSVKIAQPLNCNCWFDSTSLISNSKIKLYFHWPKNCNKENLLGYDIFRSAKENAKYKKINQSFLTNETLNYIDSFPEKSNYYKIVARGLGGDSTETFSIMALLPDVSAPAPPKKITASIDTNGKVIIRWQANKEKDLKGYRIFRCNALYEDVSEITKVIVKDTIYTDNIELKTLSKWVMYRLTAVDNVYNNSPFSEWVILRRPDKIAPVAPVFKKVIQEDSVIVLHWTNSPSDDVWRYSLYRESENKNRQLIANWFTSDSINDYQDLYAKDKNYFRYVLQLCDSSLNYTEIKSGYLYKQAKKILQPIKLNAKANRDEKNIILNWEAPNEKIFRYVIYRKKENEEWRIHKTVNGQVLSFKDKELNISNVYLYKIKAETDDGRESKLGDEVKIIY